MSADPVSDIIMAMAAVPDVRIGQDGSVTRMSEKSLLEKTRPGTGDLAERIRGEIPGRSLDAMMEEQEEVSSAYRRMMGMPEARPRTAAGGGGRSDVVEVGHFEGEESYIRGLADKVR